MSLDLLSSNIHHSCQMIIDGVRSSNLNFSLQETPFSLYVTIRKSYYNTRNYSNRHNQSEPLLDSSKEIDALKAKYKLLEEALESLKEKYEDEINENETNQKTISALKNQVEVLHSKNDKIVAEKVKSFSVEKRNLQLKHEKTCAENKTLKNEIEDLKRETNNLKVA